MPPKKEERKPLEPIFELSEPFYIYKNYNNEEIEQINQFLTYFKPELSQLLKNNIYDNMDLLCKSIGVNVHPSFVKPIVIDNFDDFDENQQFKNPDDEDQIQNKEPSIIQIQSIKIDICTIKLFDFCCGISSIMTLKLVNNHFSEEEQKEWIALIVNPENKIKKLFLDWNNISVDFLKAIPQSINLEFLTLRACHLSLQHLEGLCSSIKYLKCLDLYENQLTKEGLDLIGKMLQGNASMEFLGLARNGIQSFDELVGITQNIGKFLMSNEEYEEYKVKEKERDAVVERNKKVKKKGTEELVPVLEPVVQVDNNYYIVRNSRLWLINLAMNLLDDNSREGIEKFLNQTGENFQLVLTGNKFEDQKSLLKTKKRFGKKLVI